MELKNELFLKKNVKDIAKILGLYYFAQKRRNVHKAIFVLGDKIFIITKRMFL
jgi:hypothetical protein